jgi:hypothetical protein
VGEHREVDRPHGAIRPGHPEQDPGVKGATKAIGRQVCEVGWPEAAGDEGVPGEAHHRLPPAPESRKMGDASVGIGKCPGRGIVKDRQERVHPVTLSTGLVSELLLLGGAFQGQRR